MTGATVAKERENCGALFCIEALCNQIVQICVLFKNISIELVSVL